ncbi:hypothetical protein PV416_26530 [Streptomyces ipomoeae]|jgi:hypothetical protein|uniref:hypothetical protein n=1 Tax=Streptomyces ipomoeae TaxID=103232 RepID=UPI0029AC77BD|nr:hypothetical protein [Streptomyces ipomoeae]MDX2824557.1 hypothetical protein [Streptomyces ipomoeae]MDX2873570.1 hypothetical protein [Streptomyces ipomoeae]
MTAQSLSWRGASSVAHGRMLSWTRSPPGDDMVNSNHSVRPGTRSRLSDSSTWQWLQSNTTEG